jgi:hypothetical protein
MSTQEIYEEVMRWPASERIRLAALILNGLVEMPTDGETAAEQPANDVISGDEIRSSLDRVYARYSDTLKRLAE